jgi:hypothetical protein
MSAPTVSRVTKEVSLLLQKAYGENLISAFFYGPCTHEDFKAGSAPLEMALVLKDEKSQTLDLGRKAVASLKKKSIHVRFFLTPDFIKNAVDVYPIELLGMKQTMVLTYGTDVLSHLSFSPSDLRTQIEKELRGLLLHLRSQWLHMSLSDAHQKSLIGSTLMTLMPIFRAVLFLQNQENPKTYLGILSQVEAFAGIPGTFQKLRLQSFSKPDWRELFDEYQQAIEKTIFAIDQFHIPH